MILRNTTISLAITKIPIVANNRAIAVIRGVCIKVDC